MELKLLICFIHKKKLLDQVLAKLIDLGVGGATVIDSTGIGRSKADDIMIYEGYKDVLRGAKKNHYTVMCVINKSKVKEISSELTSLYGDFEQKGIGFFFTIPIDKMWGIHFKNKK